MPVANCAKCEYTSFSSTITATVGGTAALIYCGQCGAVVGAIPTDR